MSSIQTTEAMKTLRTERRRWLLSGLLLAGLGATTAMTAAEFKEELHQTYPMTADGQISLDNINGAVRITVWDRAEVKLDAVKRARQKEHLEAVKIEIEAKPDRLQVHTKYPDSKSWFGGRRANSTAVDYTLTVPRTVRLKKVSAVNGTVEIEGVRGEIDASTVNGMLRAEGLAANAELSSVNGGLNASFVHLDGVKSVSLSTVNGRAELTLPADANADLSASTVNGSISGDIAVKKNWPIGREAKTRLGEGGTKIQLSSVNGGLRIHLAKAGGKD